LNLLPENEFTTHFTKVPDIDQSHYEVWKTWIEKAQTDPEAARVVDLIVHHPAAEFYDTQSDPWEMKNLIDDPEHAERVAAFREKLTAWMAEQGDPGLEQTRTNRQ